MIIYDICRTELYLKTSELKSIMIESTIIRINWVFYSFGIYCPNNAPMIHYKKKKTDQSRWPHQGDCGNGRQGHRALQYRVPPPIRPRNGDWCEGILIIWGIISPHTELYICQAKTPCTLFTPTRLISPSHVPHNASLAHDSHFERILSFLFLVY